MNLKILFKFDNTLQLLINRAFFPRNGPNIYLLDGMEVLIDHSAGDQDGARSCLAGDVYDPCFELFGDLPKSISVLDLGANGGGFLLALKRWGWGIRRGVAVELNPHTHSRLSLNVLRNIPGAHANLQLLNGAAAAEDGELEVNLGRGSVGDSVEGSSSRGEDYRLPAFSFRSLCDRFEKGEDIDICKIDIEGAEYALLEGTSPELLRRCRHIIIELHDMPGKSQADLIRRIVSAGFEEIKTKRPLPEASVHLFRRLS